MYLSSFYLPGRQEEEALIAQQAARNGGRFGYVDNLYPCGLFTEKELEAVYFDRITVFCGGNGSGKSTLLNLIAERLGLARTAPFNSGEMFTAYAAACSCGPGCDDDGRPLAIPEDSRILTSDDVFDYMLAVRSNNEEIAEKKAEAREEWAALKFGDTVKFGGMEDYEALRLQVLARSRSVSRRQFIRRTAGQEAKLASNGETALRFFTSRLKEDTLYCLDEPENSLSPKLQQELAQELQELARYCGCQFILATHSPFLLALEGARIYDLDRRPAAEARWWELDNVQTYYRFFRDHRGLFEREE